MALKVKTNPAKNLKNRFRLVVLNDETFEEKLSLSLTRTNIWVLVGVTTFTLIFLTSAAIIYTPLKYFIPGFGDYNYRSQILQLKFKTDSLQEELSSRQEWLDNLTGVFSGRVDTARSRGVPGKAANKAQVKLDDVKPEDQKLRKEVEDEENFSLSYNSNESQGAVAEVKERHLMNPVDGYMTEPYDVKKEHYGVDIAAKPDAPVRAVLDGKVISASYTLETGYVIEVQHDNNLVSIYKHNSRLLKKAGSIVKSGEVLAMVGNTGEFTTGPHLHFELWYQGKSLNPKDYIAF